MVIIANIEEQYAKYPKLKKADVLALLDWASKQPHLPQITELNAAYFLHCCDYSNETAKVCIDNFFTYRTHCPEFFANLDPKSKELQAVLDTTCLVALPKLTPKGRVIFYVCLTNTNPDVFNFNAVLKILTMKGILHGYENGCTEGYVMVIDLQGFQLKHLLKVSAVSLKKYIYFLHEARPLRLKGMHLVNGVSFMDKVLALSKPFLTKEFQRMLRVHFGTNETIFQFIPKECLPIECGGEYASMKDLYVEQRKYLEENGPFFAHLEQQLVDESRRPGKPKNAGELFGVEGTFKKLDID